MRVLLTALLFSLCATITAQPRFTDSTFGTNGKIIRNTSIPSKEVIDMVLQTDGKSVVLAGVLYDAVSRIVLVRYNTNGTLDNTFSGNGIADSLFLPNINFYPAALKLQPDGKILVCGTTYNFPNAAFVIRYLPNGNLDSSFGLGGIFYQPVATVGTTATTVVTINNVAVMTNGKLLLISNNIDTADLLVTRLNPNGKIDSTWGTAGTVAVNVSSSFSPQYTKIEVQTDGKILIGGNPNEYGGPSGTALNLVVVRLNANGTPDNSFGTGGRVALHPGPAGFDYLKDMVLQPDGKVLVSGVGNSFDGHYVYAFVIRLLSNGTPDNGFGSAGVSYLLPGPYNIFFSYEGRMSLQADGKILLPGSSGTTTVSNTTALARLTAGGQPDGNFDNDGFVSFGLNGYNNYAAVARQQPDGKIAVAGIARNTSLAATTLSWFTITDYPAAVNTVGFYVPVGSGTNEEAGVGVELQPDGKILSINRRYNGAGYDLGISRYKATGVPDSSYNPATPPGSWFFEYPAGGYTSFFSGLLSNGMLMLSTSYSTYFLGTGIFITRLTANGTPDGSFGMNGNGQMLFKTRTGSYENAAPQVAFQPDGKTVLLYTQRLNENGPDSTFLVRLTANGRYDSTFNGKGKRYLPDSIFATFTNICLQPDGKILVAEDRFDSNFDRYTALRRIAVNGTNDNSFHNGTPVGVPISISDISLQADGKILMSAYNAVVARLLPSGSPDTSFGTGGIADVTAVFPGLYGPITIKEADSNRIVMAAMSYDSLNAVDYAQVVALKKNGTPDWAFGDSAQIDEREIYLLGYSNKNAAVQANGKILLTGTVKPPSNFYEDAILTRLKSNILTTGRLYTFTGSGLWSSPANWSDGTVPPSTITAGSSLMIDPPAGGECVIDISVHVQAGATVTVKAGKKVRLPGNLIIQ